MYSIVRIVYFNLDHFLFNLPARLKPCRPVGFENLSSHQLRRVNVRKPSISLEEKMVEKTRGLSGVCHWPPVMYLLHRLLNFPQMASRELNQVPTV